MRKNLMKKTLCLSAAAGLLIGGLTVGRAMAYFTSYAETGGSVAMNMGITTIVPDETVEEQQGGWVKRIRVENTGDYPCFVRVKLLYGQTYTVVPELGEGWRYGGANDDYYYFDSVVGVGEKTESELRAEIKAPGSEEDPLEDGDNFNVIVVTECTPVIYVDGQPTADWSGENVVIRQESPMVEEGE